MLLTQIKAEGLKGKSFSYPLSPANAIIGPNWSGKTAIIEAIKFLCRGKFPEVKKGDWPEATVQGSFEPNGSIKRSINSKGTVGTVAVPADLADSLDIPALDPEYYFGLTDRERTNYVFERIKLPDSFTAKAIIAEIERLSLGEKHTEEIESAKGDVISDLRPDFTDVYTVQESLGIALDRLRERFTYWNRRCKETQGAVTTLTELKLRQKQVTAAPADLDKKIAEAAKEISRCNTQMGEIQAQIKAIEGQEATRKSLEKYLSNDRTDFDALRARARTKIKSITDELDPLNERLMKIDFQELQDRWELFDEDQRNSAERFYSDKVDSLKASIEDLNKQAHCPYCRSDAKGWKTNAQRALTAQLKEETARLKAQTERRETAFHRKSELEKQISEYRQLAKHADELKDKVEELSDEIDRITAEKDRDAQQRADWKEQLKTLAVTLDVSDLKSQLQDAALKLEAAEVNSARLNAIRTTETRLSQDLVRAGEAAQENTAAQAQLAVTKKVATLIQDKRNEMVLTAFETLLGIANKFCAGILRAPLTMSDGVIAMGNVTHHWFSGTEKAIAYIAIAVALSASAPFKLVILDEFGRLDKDNQLKVSTRLSELVDDGTIDQFIIAGTSLPKEPGPKLNVIKVK